VRALTSALPVSQVISLTVKTKHASLARVSSDPTVRHAHQGKLVHSALQVCTSKTGSVCSVWLVAASALERFVNSAKTASQRWMEIVNCAIRLWSFVITAHQIASVQNAAYLTWPSRTESVVAISALLPTSMRQNSGVAARIIPIWRGNLVENASISFRSVISAPIRLSKVLV
jgi:hypothetical protein